MTHEHIAVLCIDKAWVDERDKSLIGYNLVDPNDVDHVLVTPRSSKLGKLLLKEIKEVEKEDRALNTFLVEHPNGWVEHDTPQGNAPATHPYARAGDDTQETTYPLASYVDPGTVIGRLHSDGRVRLFPEVT